MSRRIYAPHIERRRAAPDILVFADDIKDRVFNSTTYLKRADYDAVRKAAISLMEHGTVDDSEVGLPQTHYIVWTPLTTAAHDLPVDACVLTLTENAVIATFCGRRTVSWTIYILDFGRTTKEGTRLAFARTRVLLGPQQSNLELDFEDDCQS